MQIKCQVSASLIDPHVALQSQASASRSRASACLGLANANDDDLVCVSFRCKVCSICSYFLFFCGWCGCGGCWVHSTFLRQRDACAPHILSLHIFYIFGRISYIFRHIFTTYLGKKNYIFLPRPSGRLRKPGPITKMGRPICGRLVRQAERSIKNSRDSDGAL